MRARIALLTLTMIGLVAARPPMQWQPNPSGVVAAEIALNRLVQEKGQWTGFRESVAIDSVLLVPEQVNALTWLKGRSDPEVVARWSASTVYVSCNGNLAASTGNWKRTDSEKGYFTHIWRRDSKGRWKLLASEMVAVGDQRTEPEFLVGKVATCKRRAQNPNPIVPVVGKQSQKVAPVPPIDESLIWTIDASDERPHITVQMWTGEGYERMTIGN